MEPYLVLVERYLQYLNTLCPDVVAIKAESSANLARMKLPHIKWMLMKMKEPNFQSKTHPMAWISWCQQSLYVHGIIDPQHEIDVTREICKQYEGFKNENSKVD